MIKQSIINGFKVTLTLSNTKQPAWSVGVHNHYKVKIAKDGKSHTFDFFGSIHMAENDIHPTIEEVLDCFAMDVLCGQLSFEDFCSDMGGSTDSIKDQKSWKACVRSAKAAEKLGISNDILGEWREQ